MRIDKIPFRKQKYL